VDELIKSIKDDQIRKVLAEMLLTDDDYPRHEESILGMIKTLKDKKLKERQKELELIVAQGKPSDEINKEYQQIVRYLKGGKSLSA